jgi:hypothetical protein
MKKTLKTLTLASLAFICGVTGCFSQPSNWSFKPEKDKTSLYYDGQLVTSFHAAAPNKPALHPVIANDGQDLTRAFPYGSREGEREDHPHHTGIWFAHGDVNGIDFWHVDRGKPGKILEKNFNTELRGHQAIAKGSYEWSGPDNHIILEDQRIISFERQGSDLILDWEMHLKATDQTVTFGDTKEGTFALRFHGMLVAKGEGKNARMINAQGQSGKHIWGEKSKWVAYSGTHNNGKHYTVAVFDHPQNLRHPTTWHARDYGLLAVNPFGLKYFTNNKKKGEFTLKAGQTLKLKYRIIFQTQDANSENLIRSYERYLKTIASK